MSGHHAFDRGAALVAVNARHFAPTALRLRALTAPVRGAGRAGAYGDGPVCQSLSGILNPFEFDKQKCQQLMTIELDDEYDSPLDSAERKDVNSA